MTATKPVTARVSVDYSQYWVAAGPDIEVGEESVPGLLRDLGPQAVAVITGRQFGKVTVSAMAIPAPPGDIETGWDVVAETDLECPEGVISVCDWAGPDHPELGELAISGPGRYRVRVHARNRATGQKRSTETHYLLIWPVTEEASTHLLTPMDEHGRVFSGEEEPERSPPDELDLAAATAVKLLANLVNQPGAPRLPGQLTEIRTQTTASATPREVWNQVSQPWNWVGLGGSTNPLDFEIYLHREPSLTVRGGLITEEPPGHLAITWSWTSTFSSWMLPAEPTTVHIYLSRHGKGMTMVELEHRDLPAELVDAVQPFWEWALRELHNRLTKAPFYGYPWDR